MSQPRTKQRPHAIREGRALHGALSLEQFLGNGRHRHRHNGALLVLLFKLGDTTPAATSAPVGENNSHAILNGPQYLEKHKRTCPSASGRVTAWDPGVVSSPSSRHSTAS